MDIGMRHLHVTAVVLLLFFILFKTILLLVNKTVLLDKIRNTTKIIDILLGVVAVGTGVYLLTLKLNVESYIWVKILTVLVAIPLGIVGLKRHKKPLAVLSVLLIIYAFGVGETHSFKFKRDQFTVTNTDQAGREIYQTLCVECHGADGKKGLYKAPDLTESVLSGAETTARILYGKGIMKGYKNELNDQQVQEVIEYISTLR
jgi:cytochrome c553